MDCAKVIGAKVPDQKPEEYVGLFKVVDLFRVEGKSITLDPIRTATVPDRKHLLQL